MQIAPLRHLIVGGIVSLLASPGTPGVSVAQPTFTLNRTIEINHNTPNGPNLMDDSKYGADVTTIGDLDRDGVDDIAVGARRDSAGGADRGAVFIHFLNHDGSVKSTAEINYSTPNGPDLQDGDQYGFSVAAIGDLDRDGINDIAVGAFLNDTGGTDRGAVFIHFLNHDGSVKSTTEINHNTPNGPNLQNADSYGSAVATIGDLDHDGVNDIAVGAFLDDTGGNNCGAVFIHFLNHDGSVKSTTEINHNTPNGPNLQNADSYGSAVATIGDLDRDGINDIAVGAFLDDAGGTDRGSVFIHFLNHDGSVKSTAEINHNTPNGPNLQNDDQYGFALAATGDRDRDGVNDIAVGARRDDTGGVGRGAIHIHFLNRDGSVKSTTEINHNSTNGPNLNSEDQYGSGVTVIGDLNHDGINEIAAGALLDDAGGNNRGAVHIHFFNRDASLKSTAITSTIEINHNTPNGPNLENEDQYSQAVAAIGDLDRDGINDIAVGARFDDAGGTDRGAVHIHFLNQDGAVKSTIEINHNTPNGPNLQNDDWYGSKIAAMGDLDRDGVNDIAVGARLDDAGGTDRGAVHIHFLNQDGAVKSTIEINHNSTNGPNLTDRDEYGSSIAAIGDLDRDGINDIAVGARFDDAGGTDRGAVHIHFLNQDGSVKSTAEINHNTPNGPNLQNDDWYGSKIAAMGDLDRDGVNDIAVGARLDDAGGTDRGAVYIHFLNQDGSVKRTSEINHNTPNGPNLTDHDEYGSSITAIGDLDRDGVNDIAVGAYLNDTAGTERGAVFIHFLNHDGAVKSTIEINADTLNGPNLADFDQYGFAVAAIGDLDGNGVNDMAAGAQGDDTGGDNRGALHIHFLNFSFPPLADHDHAVTQLDTPVVINVTNNDTDRDGTIDTASVDLDPLTPRQQTAFTVTGEGTFTDNGDGSITFTPDMGFSGISTAFYTIADNVGTISNTATITITVDDDQDGIPTADEDVNRDRNFTNDDTDNDTILDYLDSDDDGDGLPTANEDTNGNGDPTDDDTDGDGIPNYLDAADSGPGQGDSDRDGILDHVECPSGLPCPDTNGDGTPNYMDSGIFFGADSRGVALGDLDGDGIIDAFVANASGHANTVWQNRQRSLEDANDDGDARNDDTDGDDIPNYLDADDDGADAGDSDGDGIPDDVECPGGPPCADSDRDGIPDYADPN